MELRLGHEPFRVPRLMLFSALLQREWGDWQSEAACARTRGSGGTTAPIVPPELFYRDTSSRGRRMKRLTTSELEAKRLCVRCPVRAQCLMAGWDDEYGVWGGSTPSERRRYRGLGIDGVLEWLDDQAESMGLVLREGEMAV